MFSVEDSIFHLQNPKTCVSCVSVKDMITSKKL